MSEEITIKRSPKKPENQGSTRGTGEPSWVDDEFEQSDWDGTIISALPELDGVKGGLVKIRAGRNPDFVIVRQEGGNSVRVGACWKSMSKQGRLYFLLLMDDRPSQRLLVFPSRTCSNWQIFSYENETRKTHGLLYEDTKKYSTYYVDLEGSQFIMKPRK